MLQFETAAHFLEDYNQVTFVQKLTGKGLRCSFSHSCFNSCRTQLFKRCFHTLLSIFKNCFRLFKNCHGNIENNIIYLFQLSFIGVFLLLQSQVENSTEAHGSSGVTGVQNSITMRGFDIHNVTCLQLNNC